MRHKAIGLIVGAAVASTSGSACGMTQSSRSLIGCRVTGAEKLSSAIGGEQGICAAIEQAVAAEAPGVGYSVDVRVVSRAVLSATITLANGNTLPEQKIAISDSELRRSTVARFAKSLAARIAEAS